jgi:hypothetical protein
MPEAVEDEVSDHTTQIGQVLTEIELLKQRVAIRETQRTGESPLSAGSTMMSRKRKADEIDETLPDRDLTSQLVSLYFDRIHPQFPILHKERSTQELVSFVMSDDFDAQNWPLILYAIVAVSLRFLHRRSIAEEDRTRYYKSCTDKLILSSLSITETCQLQAMVVLAIDMVGISNGPQTWGIISLICAAAIHLGLCREEAKVYNLDSVNGEQMMQLKGPQVLPPSKDFVEQESRRRLFWGIYMLDRVLAVATSFNVKIDDGEIDRMLPISESFWKPAVDSCPPRTVWYESPSRTDYQLQNRHFVDPFGYMIQILQILGNIHRFLRRTLNIYSSEDVAAWQEQYRDLDSRLAQWHDELPSEIASPIFVYGEFVNPMIVSVHSMFHTAVIRLHSTAGYAYLKSEYFTSSAVASQKCLNAVNQVIAIARHVVSSGTWHQLGPHYAWMLWVSARLLLVDCVTTHRKFPTDLDFLVSALDKMGHSWKVAARYWEILTLVIDEELSLRKERPQASGISEDSESKRLSSAQILADMGRNAYSLDAILNKEKDSGTAKDGSPSHGSHKQASAQSATSTTPPEPPIMAAPQAQPVSMSYRSRRASPTPMPSNLGAPEERELNDALNGMFDWFNFPRPVGLDGTSTPNFHSLDEYRNLVGNKDFPYVNYRDWLEPSNSPNQ